MVAGAPIAPETTLSAATGQVVACVVGAASATATPMNVLTEHAPMTRKNNKRRTATSSQGKRPPDADCAYRTAYNRKRACSPQLLAGAVCAFDQALQLGPGDGGVDPRLGAGKGAESAVGASD